MKIASTSIPDVKIIESQVFGDERGFFMESYSSRKFADGGIDTIFVQDNHSKSKKGVLRGLHFQTENTQAKLVRVTAGSVYDVAVDIRKNSPTYGQWIGELLSADNKKQLFVPKGFAHGFLTLEDDTEFLYKCDDYYNPSADGGIVYNDPALEINREEIMQQYDITNLIISEKDQHHPTFETFSSNNPF